MLHGPADNRKMKNGEASVGKEKELAFVLHFLGTGKWAMHHGFPRKADYLGTTLGEEKMDS